MTAGLLATSSGVPSAMVRPKLMAWMRSDMVMMTFMICSMIRMVIPFPRIFRINEMASSSSDGFSPAAVSSSRRSSGCVARARAISSRFRPAMGRLLAGLSRSFVSEQKSRISSARARAALMEFTRQKAEAVTLSSTLIRARGLTTWKVLPIPRRQIRWVFMPVMRVPLKTISPEVTGK